MILISFLIRKSPLLLDVKKKNGFKLRKYAKMLKICINGTNCIHTLISQALCKVSKRLRQRSLPPPAPPPKYEFSLPRPSAYTTVGKPAPMPRVVASDYYKKYIKSVYEREPMFKVR